MILQVHTSDGIIELDTEINTTEEFAQYGLDKSTYQPHEFSGTILLADGKTMTIVNGEIVSIV